MTNVDAPLDAHLNELATVCGSRSRSRVRALRGIPRLCRPHSGDATVVSPSAPSWARARSTSIGRDAQSADSREEELRRAINELSRFDGLFTCSRRRRATARSWASSRSRSDLAWALHPAERTCVDVADRRSSSTRSAIALLAIVFLPLPAARVARARIPAAQARETGRARYIAGLPPKACAALRADEDYWVQNQVTAAGLFKPGLFRMFLATAILQLTDYACRHIYNRGSLSGLNTIHFARWVPLDGGRRMFFSSNYDGSLESYMDDFIDKAAWGLNAIFSNGDGFPADVLPVLRRDHRREGLQAIPADPTGAIAGLVQRLSAPDDEEHRQQRGDPGGTVGSDERRRHEDVARADSGSATSCPSQASSRASLDSVPLGQAVPLQARRHPGNLLYGYGRLRQCLFSAARHQRAVGSEGVAEDARRSNAQVQPRRKRSLHQHRVHVRQVWSASGLSDDLDERVLAGIS